jgi:hypothetical protein
MSDNGRTESSRPRACPMRGSSERRNQRCAPRSPLAAAGADGLAPEAMPVTLYLGQGIDRREMAPAPFRVSSATASRLLNCLFLYIYFFCLKPCLILFYHEIVTECYILIFNTLTRQPDEITSCPLPLTLYGACCFHTGAGERASRAGIARDHACPCTASGAV